MSTRRTDRRENNQTDRPSSRTTHLLSEDAGAVGALPLTTGAAGGDQGDGTEQEDGGEEEEERHCSADLPTV